MKYIYEKEQKNYEDFASGRVLYNQKGATAFPVRLASEIFLRSKAYLEDKNINRKITVYDPFCGGGYLLTILGFLHGKDLAKLIASDIDENILGLAKRNLSLLTQDGINKRIEKIKDDIVSYDKDSHREALVSAARLKDLLKDINPSLEIRSFKGDATIDHLLSEEKVDLVLTDLPYGKIAQWFNDNDNNLELFLHNIESVLKATSILAIISDKGQKIEHGKYNRIKHFTTGKRRVSFLELNR